MSDMTGHFVWHDLMTTELDGAEAFYATVCGWRMQDSGMPGRRYTLASVGDTRVAGLMALPPEAASAGPGWTGYIAVADVDATAERVARAGGTVHRAPDDIPGIGRFAVVADPQGAGFVLFHGTGGAPPPLPAGTPGAVGWNELHASDWEAAFGFYADLFGWRKSTAVDMGPMGTYQLFAAGGTDIGGMMTSPGARPHWLFYVTVDEIDAAASRVAAAGGVVTNGPHPVPGGQWILQGRDPQGVTFALVGGRASAA